MIKYFTCPLQIVQEEAIPYIRKKFWMHMLWSPLLTWINIKILFTSIIDSFRKLYQGVDVLKYVWNPPEEL